MNRELKFRAFHKVKKEMYDVYSFCNEFVRVITDIDLVEKFRIDEFEPLMQFTGSKTKNGIDIYEMDIDDKGRLIEWFNEMSCYGCKSKKYSHVHFLSREKKHITIEGNFYQHINKYI